MSRGAARPCRGRGPYGEGVGHATAAETGPVTGVRQSNHEGVPIGTVHEARTAQGGVVGSPAGHGRTSPAPRDAPRPRYVPGAGEAVVRRAGARGHALALRHGAGLVEAGLVEDAR